MCSEQAYVRFVPEAAMASSNGDVRSHPMAAAQCQRLLKGGGGGDRKFVSEPPTTAINIAIRAMKTESLKLESNIQRISGP